MGASETCKVTTSTKGRGSRQQRRRNGGTERGGGRRRCHIWPNSNAINTYAICRGIVGGETSLAPLSVSISISSSSYLPSPYWVHLSLAFCCVLWPFPCSFVSKPLHAFPPIRHLTLVNFLASNGSIYGGSPLAPCFSLCSLLSPLSLLSLSRFFLYSLSLCWQGESCTFALGSHGNLS